MEHSAVLDAVEHLEKMAEAGKHAQEVAAARGDDTKVIRLSGSWERPVNGYPRIRLAGCGQPLSRPEDGGTG
jgi:hypothetical protein